jgi:hypothetical protein
LGMWHFHLKAYHDSGMMCDAFARAFDEQLNFASLGPCVQNPFPCFMKLGRHEMMARQKISPRAFWQVLDLKAMSDAGFSRSQIDAKQESLVAYRMASIVKSQVVNISSLHPFR